MKVVSLDSSDVEWRERPHDDLVLAIGLRRLAGRPAAPGVRPGFYLAVVSADPPAAPRWPNWR